MIKHSTSAVNPQLYYDEFPIGVILPWHKSLYARTQNALSTGNATTNTTDHLIDTGAAFDDDEISVGDIAYNSTDGEYASITNVTATDLTLSRDAFPLGTENYEIFKEPTLPKGWMEYSNVAITDLESPFYGLTPEDIIGEERFLRFCETSGINQADAFQGHYHDFYYYGVRDYVSGSSAYRLANNPGTGPAAGNHVRTAKSDGLHGTPRTDDETRPINISFVAIFKYKKAPAQTSTFQSDILYTGQFITQVEKLSGNYTITSSTNKSFFPITTGASDYTVTLPPLSESLGREITISKDDSGVGEVAIDGYSTETIEGFTNVYLARQYDTITLKGTSSTWLRKSGILQVVSGEPCGGDWFPIENPGTGYISTKLTGWTADSFSGGLIVDFSPEVPIGTKAVRIAVLQQTTYSSVFYRKDGDANISNTPLASNELSHWLLRSAETQGQVVVWLSSDYKTQFAVTDINTDLYITYPSEYMRL